MLIENVTHHIEEEEKDWFPKVQALVGRKQLAGTRGQARAGPEERAQVASPAQRAEKDDERRHRLTSSRSPLQTADRARPAIPAGGPPRHLAPEEQTDNNPARGPASSVRRPTLADCSVPSKRRRVTLVGFLPGCPEDMPRMAGGKRVRFVGPVRSVGGAGRPGRRTRASDLSWCRISRSMPPDDPDLVEGGIGGVGELHAPR